MIRMGVSGWLFLLVLAHPDSPRERAVKWLCVCITLINLWQIFISFIFTYLQQSKQRAVCCLGFVVMHTCLPQGNCNYSLWSVLCENKWQISQCYHTWMMMCWCVFLSGAMCRLFAYSPADASAILQPRHLLLHLNPDWFTPFWFLLT